MDRETVRAIGPSARVVLEPAQTAGLRREQAFAGEGVWVGVARTPPGVASGWHHHGDHDTYVYVLSGRAKLEFGPGGKQTVEGGPGAFVNIQRRVVHRESNVADVEAEFVVFRVGSGQPLFNVDGPEPDR